MTSIEKRQFLSISAALLALLVAVGCGGGSEDSTTVTGSDPPRAEQGREPGSTADRQGREDAAKAKPSAEKAPPRTADKKAKGGGRTPTADAHEQKHAQPPDDVEERVRELVNGDSGVRVVDSPRELRKVLREIKREKQEEDVPPVLKEVLEKARGG